MSELKDMRLVGGTSLALQYGHRRSVDLDFFGRATEDVDELTDALKHCVDKVVLGGHSKSIKSYFLILPPPLNLVPCLTPALTIIVGFGFFFVAILINNK